MENSFDFKVHPQFCMTTQPFGGFFQREEVLVKAPVASAVGNGIWDAGEGHGFIIHDFAFLSILAQVSLSCTVRLQTSFSTVESRSTLK